jgi:hypothetical protein
MTIATRVDVGAGVVVTLGAAFASLGVADRLAVSVNVLVAVGVRE